MRLSNDLKIILTSSSDIYQFICKQDKAAVEENYMVRMYSFLWPLCCLNYVVDTGKRERRFAHFKDSGNVLSFLSDGKRIKMYLPLLDEHGKGDVIQMSIFNRRSFYEYAMLSYFRKHYVKEGSVFLDCGANIGNHSLFFATICNAKKVIAVEGAEDTFKILNKNIKINNLKGKVDLINCVLGETEGFASISRRYKDNIGGTQFDTVTGGTIPVKTADSITSDDIDYVKIDVEGSELKVLKGMNEILSKNHPIIWIESFPDKVNEVRKHLESFGYLLDCKMISGNYIFA